MKIQIITNLVAEKGLKRDHDLLKVLFEQSGHEVRGVQFDHHGSATAADLNIFLEVCEPVFFKYAPRQWLIPNAEWWFPTNNQHLPKFERILCKTHDALRIFRESLCTSAEYLGFIAEDHYRPEIIRDFRFYHNPGQSIVRNTDAIINAWDHFKIPFHLTILSEVHDAGRNAIPNVTFIGRVSNEELITLQNSHLFHLCISEYEGYGQALHESLGVGAVVITTDAPPMNEYKESGAFVTCPVDYQIPLRLTLLNKVSPEDIRDVVYWVAERPAAEVEDLQRSARKLFLYKNAAFLERFKTLLTSL